MEMVNKKYLRIEKSEIFIQELAGLYSGNEERRSFFEEMISIILDYEKDPNKTGKR